MRTRTCTIAHGWQAGLVYRAIKMNIKLFRWDRALDLAQQYKQHVETVLWYRQRYLGGANAEESMPRFQVCDCVCALVGL